MSCITVIYFHSRVSQQLKAANDADAENHRMNWRWYVWRKRCNWAEIMRTTFIGLDCIQRHFVCALITVTANWCPAFCFTGWWSSLSGSDLKSGMPGAGVTLRSALIKKPKKAVTIDLTDHRCQPVTASGLFHLPLCLSNCDCGITCGLFFVADCRYSRSNGWWLVEAFWHCETLSWLNH